MSPSKCPEVRDLRILPYQKERGAYEMAAECVNCGWHGRILIPMGDPAPGTDFGQRPAYCDTCGCRKVVARR